MVLHKSELMMQELNDFLDTLPKTPCDESPSSRYFCTVCERLNKSVQKRCSVYKSRMDEVGLSPDRSYDLADDEATDKPGAGDKGVEFKIIEDKEFDDDDMPLFEVVKPSGEDSKPLEMDLLEDEALEFDLLKNGDEEISEDVLEVEPMDESEEEFEGLEVEPLEVDEIEDDGPAPPRPVPVPAKRPMPKPVARAPKPVATAVASPKPRVKVKKKVAAKKPTAAGKPQPRVKKAAAAPKVVAGGRPKPVRKKPRVAASASGTVPKPASGESWKQVPQESSTVDIIADIEKQLVIGHPCTQCGTKLSNPNFCVQCGAKIVITGNGVTTVPR